MDCVPQTSMKNVFLTKEYRLYWYSLFDAKAVVLDGDAFIGLWYTEVVTLVLEDNCLREYCTFDATYEFALGEWGGLKVEVSHHAIV